MPAYPALYLLLVEPEPERARALSHMLASLNTMLRAVPDVAHADQILSQIQPDRLLIGLHPANARAVRAWLAGRAGATPTLLYAEHSALLDLAAMQPHPVLTALWPCSRSELALLLGLVPP